MPIIGRRQNRFMLTAICIQMDANLLKPGSSKIFINITYHKKAVTLGQNFQKSLHFYV